MKRWIGLVLFLEIGRMRCVSGLDYNVFGVEIWICWLVRVGQWMRDGGSRRATKLVWWLR